MNRFKHPPMREMVFLAVTAALMILSVLPATCDDVSTARTTLAKWENAIVTVQYVVKMRITVEGKDSQTHDEQAEITGTILDASGLTLIPLSATDPSEAFGFGEDRGNSIGIRIDFKSELADVKIRLADGKEIPADVVLRDKDLDFVFVKPKQKPDVTLTHIDLASSYTPQLLDKVVTLARLGKVANRTIAGSIGRIQAIINKPRSYYVLRVPDNMGDIGCPVFSLDGKLAGVRVLKSIPVVSGSRFLSENYLPVVIPTADIAEVAKQALEKR